MAVQSRDEGGPSGQGQDERRGEVLMDTIRSSEITDKTVYMNRRRFLATAFASAGGAMVNERALRGQQPAVHGRKLATVRSPWSTTERPNTWEQITTYNNFYEYESRGGAGPSKLATHFKSEPWTVMVDGECARRGRMNLEDILKGETLEDRIYRHRCVEAWSMVIPWVGFPLGNFIKRCEPTSRAAFIEFTTLLDPTQFPGQRRQVLDWPYVEGLRMDEAMHPLTILCVGLYGEILPNQNGAPLRLVVPWKYGFKGIKSIVRVRFVERQPISSWQRAYSRAYGFYANVNPTVDHPNWSQATETRLPSLFKSTRTMMFNGYGEQVAAMYAGMDLQTNY
jgi:sulfoxide reductase catalytic subunit YedY